MRFELRLALLFLAMSLLPVVGVTMVLDRVEERQIESKVANHLTTALELKDGTFHTWLEEKEKQIVRLASDPHLSRLGTGSDPLERAEGVADLAAALAADPEFVEFLLINATTGQIDFSTSPGKEGKFRDHEDYFLRGREGVFTQPLFYSLPDEEFSIVVSGPVKGGNAVLAGRLDPGVVHDIMAERPGLGATGRTYVVNRFSTVISNTTVGAVIVREPLSSCEAGGGRGTYTNHLGEEVYGVWMWDGEEAFCYVAEISVTEAFAPLTHLRAGLLAGALSLAILMVGLSLYVSRLISRPVAGKLAAEASLRGIVENVPAGIAEIDSNGLVTFVNPALGALRGPDGAPLLSRGDDAVARLRSADASEPILAALEGAISRSPPADRDPAMLEAVSGAGPRSRRTVQVAAHPIGHGAGAVLLTFVDVTDLKDAERALVAREKMASIGGLAAGIAHEINNPLTFLRGNSELNLLEIKDCLAEHEVPPPVKEVLDRLTENMRVQIIGGDRIAHIVRSLRIIGKPSAERAPLSLNSILDATVAIAKHKTESVASFEIDAAADLPLAPLNPDEIGQVVLNLLANATEAAGESGRVRVRTFQEGSFVCLSVEDNGPGIPAPVARELFRPFFTTKADGTGLGLSISHRIVEEHGGALTFRSASGQGTVFVARFPIARPPSGGSP